MVVNNFFVAYWPFVYFPWRHSYLSPLLIFKFFFFFGLPACEILVLWPGFEPAPPTLKVWHLNHCTTREVPLLIFKLGCFYCWIVRIFYMFWIQFPLVAMWFTEILSHSVCSFYFLFPFLFFFFFLAMSCSLWDLCSLTVGQTRAPCGGNAESYPQDRQGIPCFYFLNSAKNDFQSGCIMLRSLQWWPCMYF